MYESEAKIDFLITAGGRIRFDLENHRAYCWFVDAPSDNRRPLRPRRVDVWVRERVRNKKDIPTWLAWAGALLIPLFIYIAYWAQFRQWAIEEEQNVKVAEGWF